MKYIYIVSLFMVLFQSCDKDREVIFEESAQARINKASEQINTSLIAGKDGWFMNYQPNEGEKTYQVVFKFLKDNKVVVIGDMSLKIDTANYRIDYEQRPVLVFDNFSSFHNIYSRSVKFSNKAEYEFFINKTENSFELESVSDDLRSLTKVELSEADPQLTKKLEKRIKLFGAAAKAIEEGSKYRFDYVALNGYVEKSFSIDFSMKQLDKGGVKTNFTLVNDGIILENPVKIGITNFSEIHFKEVNGDLKFYTDKNEEIEFISYYNTTYSFTNGNSLDDFNKYQSFERSLSSYYKYQKQIVLNDLPIEENPFGNFVNIFGESPNNKVFIVNSIKSKNSITIVFKSEFLEVGTNEKVSFYFQNIFNVSQSNWSFKGDKMYLKNTSSAIAYSTTDFDIANYNTILDLKNLTPQQQKWGVKKDLIKIQEAIIKYFNEQTFIISNERSASGKPYFFISRGNEKMSDVWYFAY
ncbi:DUF4302 domain-containing protein [Flammeovirga kamogawensis]|uniref:DUF4302 domain-containing protein n=1 Tax=Flammeovirga kamogawensis TaxID=373891 RepID=A0ABX8H2W9_9BACT|nr:DUF4302 domain-containing protein [Flammeovirga kamogawensis]MBB6460171.1 hypothetical protein [Flammeovirga kamogawensis]QWG09983.1 DUF4302 domain-containing protein [Flammeovirga kamogawensis]TRX65491.1 DUF4302 domain-containing protein [Flammeovirga kamogawensis]